MCPHRACEQKALPAFAVQFFKCLKLGICLDAFRDDFQVEIFRHRNDRPDYLGIRAVLIYQAHENSVDLQRRDRQAHQIAEIGIAGSEIIDVEQYPEGAEVVKHFYCTLLVLEKNGLGDLELQPCRGKLGPVQNVLNLVDEKRLSELAARKVDTQFQRVHLDRTVDLSDLGTSFIENELAKRVDQARLLGQRYELRRM